MSRTPHDKLFKRIFREPKHAADELRLLRPAALVDALDWNSLQLAPETHVDAELADAYSDLTFTARAGDEQVIVYILFEHQSTNDDRMALRLLDYMVRKWMQFIENKDNAKKPLPVIMPVVLSHAPGGWTAKRRFGALLSPKGEALSGSSLPDFHYAVDDLTQVSPDDLRARLVQDAVRLTLWVLRDARDGSSFLAVARAWLGVLETIAADPASQHAAGSVLVYLSRVLDDETMQEFRVMLADEAPVAEELTMTYAETLLAKGHERGHAAGKIEGRLEGKIEGRLEGKIEGRLEGKTEGKLAAEAASVLLVLEARGLSVSPEQRAHIEACRDSETLTRWLAAAVTAKSTDAVFA